jgi:hypothetical protein
VAHNGGGDLTNAIIFTRDYAAYDEVIVVLEDRTSTNGFADEWTEPQGSNICWQGRIQLKLDVS